MFPNRPARVPPGRILHVCSEPALLNTRASVLASAGYQTTSANSPQVAVALMHFGHFDLVLVCHSVRGAARGKMLAECEQMQQPTLILESTQDNSPPALLRALGNQLGRGARA